MKIIDPKHLLPSIECLQKVIDDHPFSPNLGTCIDTIKVVLSETCNLPKEIIETDLTKRRVTLGLGRSSKDKPDIKYILYHELGHVADRANPHFKYSEDTKRNLLQSEKSALMELWNLFIDARLHAVGLLELTAQQICYSKKHGRLPTGVEGKLEGHAVMLENQGIPFEHAMRVVNERWDTPTAMWTYGEMIKWVKEHSDNQPSTADVKTS